MNVDTIPYGNRWVQTCVTQFSIGCSWSILVTGAIHAKAMKSNNLQNIPAALVFSLTDVICYNDAMLRVWYWCKHMCTYGLIYWTHFMYPHYSENFKMRQKYEKNTSKWTVIEYMDIFNSYLCKPIW